MSTRRHRVVLAAGLIFAATASALGDYAPTQAQLDAIAAKPGTLIETTTEGEGKTIRITRNQVATTLKQSADGQWSETSADNSGHGAVMCIWMIYVELRAEIDLCHLSGQEALRADLDASIGRINNFVVANSLFPITKEQVDANAARRLELLRAEIEKLPAATRRNRCESGDGRQMISAFGAQSHADRIKSVDQLLSEPRPPAYNPCL